MPRNEPRGLFDDQDADFETFIESDSPFAERMRLRLLEDYIGQAHLLGRGRLVRKLNDAGGPLSPFILRGPPGTVKTTLARLLAGKAGTRFAPLSAVHSGSRNSERRSAKSGGQSRVDAVSFCSLTKSIDSTKRSKTHFCRRWKAAPSP